MLFLMTTILLLNACTLLFFSNINRLNEMFAPILVIFIPWNIVTTCATLLVMRMEIIVCINIPWYFWYIEQWCEIFWTEMSILFLYLAIWIFNDLNSTLEHTFFIIWSYIFLLWNWWKCNQCIWRNWMWNQWVQLVFIFGGNENYFANNYNAWSTDFRTKRIRKLFLQSKPFFQGQFNQ